MGKELARYLGLLVNRAAASTMQLTDRLSVLLVPFATLLLWLGGARMTETISETLALGVAITVVSVVALRFAAATFSLWREDQAEKAKLRDLLDSPLRREFEASREYTTELRHELSDTLAKLIVFAEVPALDALPDQLKAQHHIDYIATFRRSRELINALSYETALRVVSHNFVMLIGQIVKARAEGSDLAPLQEKMQAAKKITFRLLHRRAGGSQGELLAMLELKNALGLPPDADDERDDPSSVELGSKFDEMRELIRDPYLLERVRSHFENERR